ncbi:MAG: DUF922 domain-containing protein [Polyangiaceae bacterium]|nr:DUF922 domain-containing protein [Polyangiaceae bacterium]
MPTNQAWASHYNHLQRAQQPKQGLGCCSFFAGIIVGGFLTLVIGGAAAIWLLASRHESPFAWPTARPEADADADESEPSATASAESPPASNEDEPAAAAIPPAVPTEPPAPAPPPTASTAEPTIEAPPAPPKVRIWTHTKHYAIQGSTIGQLHSQLMTVGPQDALGRRWDATTDWDVRWKYDCGSDSTEVDVTIDYTMPQWSAPPEAQTFTIQRWNGYYTALEKHEQGHGDNGIAAGHEIKRELDELGSRSNCRELRFTADLEARAIIDKYAQKDVEYDARTNHGILQGVRL